MTRFLCALILAVAMLSPASASVQPYSLQTFSQASGALFTLPGATVTVYIYGTTTKASIYTISGGACSGALMTNPATADSNGFLNFCADNGSLYYTVWSFGAYTSPNVYLSPNLGSAQSILATPATQNYPGLSVSADTYRFDTGGYNPANEFYGGYTTYKGVQSFTATILTPAGTTGNCGAACQDVAGAFYAESLNVGRFALGLYAEGMLGVAGSPATGGDFGGANIVAINCERAGSVYPAACNTGKIFNFQYGVGVEINVDVFDISGAAPTGQAVGIQVLLNRGGSSNHLANSEAVYVTSFAGDQWNAAFQSNSGAAAVGIVLGATAATGTNINSQGIALVSLSSGGGAITHTLSQDPTGALYFPASGNTTQIGAGTYPQWNYTCTGICGANYISSGVGSNIGVTLTGATTNSNVVAYLTDGSGYNLSIGSGSPLYTVSIGGFTKFSVGTTNFTLNDYLVLTAFPAATGGGGYLCVDSAGNVYKKTGTCP